MMKVLGLVLVGVAFGVATLISTSNAIPNFLNRFGQNGAEPLVIKECIELAQYFKKYGYKDRDKMAQYQADCDEERATLKHRRVVAEALTGEHKGKL